MKKIILTIGIAFLLSLPMVRVLADDADTASTTTSITTGAALSGSDTETDLNSNTIDDQSDTPATAGAALTDGSDMHNSDNSSTTIENTNTATTTDAVASTADTGDNESDASNTSITTGDAFAYANILNEINTNIVNSNGLFFFLNNFLDSLGDINLSNFGTVNTADNSLSSDADQNASTTITNTNTATVTNSVIVTANTGDNTASSSDGATITTGNAYAAANVANVVNTNIVNSNYLLMVVNNFSDWNGNLILPSDAFFNNLSFAAPTSNSTTTIENTNTATVSNNATTTADTGNNIASSTNAAITTGAAVSASNVVNQVNTDETNNDSFMVLFRVFGNWNGSVFNLPAGISWMQTDNGVALIGNGSNSSPVSTISGSASTTISNTNTATVNNNVSVYTLTGANEASSSNATITTGSAVSASNIVNVVNTNIVGRNWLLAIVNIFGNWNGSISFGQPDLWIGSSIGGQGQAIGPGTELAYHFTVTNHGNADAHNVTITNDFDSPFITFEDQGTMTTDSSGNPIWSFTIGTVPAGQTVDVTYTGTIGNIPQGQTPIDDTVQVTEDEPDANMADNSDAISLIAANEDTTVGTDVVLTPDPILKITKTVATPVITASSTELYTVTIENDGGPAYHATLTDTLHNDLGDTISTNNWDLETLNPGEKVQVQFTMFYNASTSPGGYTDFAQVNAEGRNPSLNPFYGWFASSTVATSTITILGDQSNWNLAINNPVIINEVSTSTNATSTVTVTMNMGSASTPASVHTLIRPFLPALPPIQFPASVQYQSQSSNQYNWATSSFIKTFQSNNSLATMTANVLAGWESFGSLYQNFLGWMHQ